MGWVKIVYENEEFNLLQAALDIEDDMENALQ
jgi:topoisomerase-4 subunit B